MTLPEKRTQQELTVSNKRRLRVHNQNIKEKTVCSTIVPLSPSQHVSHNEKQATCSTAVSASRTENRNNEKQVACFNTVSPVKVTKVDIISLVPLEVAELIMKLLPRRNLKDYLDVSKQWRERILGCPSLWKKVVIMMENSVEYKFFNDIAYHVSHLTIDIRKHKMDNIHRKIQSIDLPSLKSLSLKSSTTITRSERSFSSILLFMSTNLTEMFLDLKYDEVSVSLSDILKKFKNLRGLQYHCLKLGQSDFESLDNLLLVWLSINIQSGIIPKSTLKHLVSRSPLLRCLHVNWVNFDIFDIFDNSNIPLNILTVGNPHKFGLSRHYINNDTNLRLLAITSVTSLNRLFHILSNNSSLKTLYIPGALISQNHENVNPSLDHLSLLPTLTNLKYINVHYITMTNPWILIGTILEKAVRLETFVLNDWQWHNYDGEDDQPVDMRTDIDTTAQIDAIAHLATFTRARFVNSNLNAPDITRLINQLALRNSQQSLVQELEYINCYGTNVASIIKAITICTLKKFRICGSSRIFRKKKDMNKLSSALGSNRSLISIVLEDFNILDDTDIKNLSKSTTITSIQFRRVSGYSKTSISLFDNHVPRIHFSRLS